MNREYLTDWTFDEKGEIKCGQIQLVIDSGDANADAKRKFIANLSHDIRTPLSVILGYTELISIQVPHKSDVVNGLSTIREQALKLLKMSNDILGLEGSFAEVTHSPMPNFCEQNLLEGVRVLLVEDGVDNQILIQRFLSLSGAIVSLAENGAAAVSRVQNGQFDVILMDIQMPVMDGYEASRQIVALGKNIPIIALTAHAMRDERDQCLASGCIDYLAKPVNAMTLVKTLAKHVYSEARIVKENDNDLLVSDFANDPVIGPIVPEFLGRLSYRMDELRRALDQNSWLEIQKISHQLCGAAGGYGFPAISEVAGKIENLARLEKSSPDLESAVVEFFELCKRAIAGQRAAD